MIKCVIMYQLINKIKNEMKNTKLKDTNDNNNLSDVSMNLYDMK